MACDLNTEGTGEVARNTVQGKGTDSVPETTTAVQVWREGAPAQSVGESNLRGGVERAAATGARTQSGRAWLDGLHGLRLIPRARKRHGRGLRRMCARACMGDEEQSLKPPNTKRGSTDSDRASALGAPFNSLGQAAPLCRTCRSNELQWGALSPVLLKPGSPGSPALR